MRVDLPSSTDPQVTSRRRSVLEVTDTLAVLHGRLADTVVRARLAALRDTGRCDLADDLVDCLRVRDHAAGARHVADRPEAHGRGERILALHALDEVGARIEHPVAAKDLAFVCEVDLRKLELLALDVLPHIELRPVRDREHAHVLALADARVVDVPELGPLRAGVPLAEIVAEREDALLRACALLVAAGSADRGIELVLLDRVEERRRLQLVARGARGGLVDDAALVDRLLHACDDQALAELLDAPVAELDHLGEVVTRVDVHDGERELAGPEGFLREAQQHDRVLAAAEEQHRLRELRADLAEDVDRLRLELVEVGERARGDAHARTPTSCSRRSRTKLADSLGLTPVVSMRISGLDGSSYGAETPVKSSISPA